MALTGPTIGVGTLSPWFTGHLRLDPERLAHPGVRGPGRRTTQVDIAIPFLQRGGRPGGECQEAARVPERAAPLRLRSGFTGPTTRALRPDVAIAQALDALKLPGVCAVHLEEKGRGRACATCGRRATRRCSPTWGCRPVHRPGRRAPRVAPVVSVLQRHGHRGPPGAWLTRGAGDKRVKVDPRVATTLARTHVGWPVLRRSVRVQGRDPRRPGPDPRAAGQGHRVVFDDRLLLLAETARMVLTRSRGLGRRPHSRRHRLHRPRRPQRRGPAGRAPGHGKPPAGHVRESTPPNRRSRAARACSPNGAFSVIGVPARLPTCCSTWCCARACPPGANTCGPADHDGGQIRRSTGA